MAPVTSHAGLLYCSHARYTPAGHGIQRRQHGIARLIASASAPLDSAVVSAGSGGGGQGHDRPLLHLLATGARLTNAAQEAWGQVLQPGDTVVDATAGNGHDTLFLARAVGPEGTVYAFDVQAEALASTHARIESSLEAASRPQMHYLQACHSRLQELVGSGAARVVAFNLGYLPAGDKAITTRTETTLGAVEAALEVIVPGGVISLLCYTGHPGGMDEYNAVRELVAGLSPGYWVTAETRLLNRPTAPILVLVWRQRAPQGGGGAAAATPQSRLGAGAPPRGK